MIPWPLLKVYIVSCLLFSLTSLQDPTKSPSRAPSQAPSDVVSPLDGTCSDGSGSCSETDMTQCTCSSQRRELQNSRILQVCSECSATCCSACDKNNNCPQGPGQCTWTSGKNGGCSPAVAATPGVSCFTDRSFSSFFVKLLLTLFLIYLLHSSQQRAHRTGRRLSQLPALQRAQV